MISDSIVEIVAVSGAVGSLVYLALARKLEKEFDLRYEPAGAVPCKAHAGFIAELAGIREKLGDLTRKIERLIDLNIKIGG